MLLTCGHTWQRSHNRLNIEHRVDLREQRFASNFHCAVNHEDGVRSAGDEDLARAADDHGDIGHCQL